MEKRPGKVCFDRAYDSNKPDERLEKAVRRPCFGNSALYRIGKRSCFECTGAVADDVDGSISVVRVTIECCGLCKCVRYLTAGFEVRKSAVNPHSEIWLMFLIVTYTALIGDIFVAPLLI